MTLRVALLAAVVSSPVACAQNLILNGSFENNQATSTIFNLTNGEFNVVVAGATAFGGRNEIDLMDAAQPYGQPPQHGNWKLGIAHSFKGSSDEFAFHLTSPLVLGHPYTVAFYAHVEPTQNPGRGPIEIGVSSSATAFGTVVYATPTVLSTTTWEHFVYEFNAPFSASYLTVRAQGVDSAWYHIDNFSLIHSVAPCYPDCNSDGSLNLSDFGCFQTKFALQDPYADCNGDGVRNLSDFGCFQTKFALGCP